MPADKERLKSLIPAGEALDIVLSDVEPCGIEEVGLHEAANRRLARDIPSLRTQPPFDASAMDGFAVRQADVIELPADLTIIGESRAGVPYERSLGEGQAVRIFTGAVVPEGADTIIIQENTEFSGSSVRVLTGTPEGKFIRKAGLDFKEGEVILGSEDVLSPNRLALVASMNYAKVPVRKNATVATISTGDELVLPGEATGPGQIIASNTYGITASAKNCGANVIDMGLVADTKDALREAFQSAISKGADVLITTGGASVGDHDLVMPVAMEMGFEFEIAKIAMRPGKPFLFARYKHDGRTVYLTGLAGNPVSSLVAFNVFVKPLINLLSGEPAEKLKPLPAVLGKDLEENDERAEYMRGTLEISADGQRIATAFTKQDSSMLANLVRADCLIFRAVKAPAAKAGDPCEIVMIS